MTTSDADPLEHVAENQRYWDAAADEWVVAGEQAWAATDPYWGAWRIPETELDVLPADMSGLDAVELGCGTGYVSAWMRRRGATVAAIDNSENQLATARRLAAEHEATDIDWRHGNAETTPWSDGSFDFAISEYGAALWCDPYVWIPEARRILRPGGALVFLSSTPWSYACSPVSGADATRTLERPYFGLHRLDWTGVDVDPGGVEFTLPISKWFALFTEVGFTVERYEELQAPPSATGTEFAMPSSWAQDFPSEHVWWLRRRRVAARQPVTG